MCGGLQDRVGFGLMQLVGGLNSSRLRRGMPGLLVLKPDLLTSRQHFVQRWPAR